MMHSNDNEDKLIEVMLEEELGGRCPPDLTGGILACAFPGRRLLSPVLAAACAFAAIVTLFIPMRSSEPGAPSYPVPTAAGAYHVKGAGKVERGATVFTRRESARLALGGYCRIKIEPDTLLRIEGSKNDESVYLERGGIQSLVDSEVGSYSVETEVGKVCALGTDFIVRVVEQAAGKDALGNRMFVKVITGAVVVSGPWGTEMLHAGQQRTLPEVHKPKPDLKADMIVTDNKKTGKHMVFTYDGRNWSRLQGKDAEEYRRKLLRRRKEYERKQEARLRAELRVKTDEEWEIIRGKINEVRELRKMAKAVVSWLHNRKYTNELGKTGTTAYWDSDKLSDLFKTNPELQALYISAKSLVEAVLAEDALDGEVKEKLSAYREARRQLEARLMKAQDELKALLSPRQEAMLMVRGVLD